MSDQMMLNILRMPIDDRGDVHMSQFIATAREAADRIEELTKEMDAMAAYVDRLCQQSESATFKPSLNVADSDCLHSRSTYAPMASISFVSSSILSAASLAVAINCAM